MSKNRLLPICSLFLCGVAAVDAHDSDAAHTHPPATNVAAADGEIIGHGSAKYRVDLNWAKADPAVAPVINSHALSEGRGGLIYLVTDHPKNAFLVFQKDGTFVRAFGAGLEGGHGLELFEKDGEEYLVHVDCGWHFAAEGWNPKSGNGRVTILKSDGTIVRKLPTPAEFDPAKGAAKFMPCDVAVTADHRILVVDGYGTDLVYEYNFDGKIVRTWGGPKPGQAAHLSNAHGISLDTSDPARPLVWIPSRNETKLKAFTLDGEHVETVDLPGAYAGQAVFRGDRIYTAVCWSKENGTGKRLNQSGFVIVLDRKTKRVISAPGGNEPVYENDKLMPLFQTAKTFIHGHDLYVDSEGAIYVGEWNANRRYPAKLTPVSTP